LTTPVVPALNFPDPAVDAGLLLPPLLHALITNTALTIVAAKMLRLFMR
jgi:hypothetical protein